MFSFKEFLLNEAMTYSPDAPHFTALQQAREYAGFGGNSLIVRKMDRTTRQYKYLAVPPGEQLPEGYEIWAEVNSRGKIRRVGSMY